MASGDLSKAEQNYTCCAKACVDFMKLPLVDILNNQIKPGDLYNKINSSSTLKLGKNKLRTDQLKLCFLPPPHIPDYSKFDVTLLYTLIRNLCPSLTPTRGWGLEPDALHITIGDDIERLRLFRNNFVHGESTEIPDYEFRTLWSNIKDVSQRIHTYTKTWSHYNYKEELSRIASLKFGYEDRDMYQSCFEAMRILWKQSQYRDEPNILIKGSEKVICGETAQFDAEVKRTETSKWSVTWQTKTGNTTTNIKSSDEKFKGSNDRRLIIHSVCKADEAEYQAVLYNGNNNYVYSNTIYLHVSGEYPFFDNWNITTGTEGLNIHYSFGVPDTSPSVSEVQWTKDGKSLELTSPKYIGGELNDSCLTITSPTLEDKGNYLCKVTNAVGTVSKNVLLDVPYTTISTDSKVVFGLKTMVKSTVSSCPPPNGVEWQNSDDGNTFRRIDINKTHYYGSSLNPESPVLAIPYTTFDDMLHYRLLVWNKIGDQYSNTLYLNVTGSLPNVMTNHEICLKEHSVKLIGKVFPNEPEHVFWTKNGEKIDTSKSGDKYSEVTVEDPSLIIFKANEHDAGSYQLIATNAVGSTHSEVIVLDKAQIDFERRENPDGKQVFKATIESTPAAYYAQWKIKGKDDLTFTPVKYNAEELKGTSNSLPYPVLVIKHRELLENKRFLLEVDNFVGNSVKEISCSEISKTSCRTEGDILSDILSTNGSKIRFNNLRLNLIEGLAEKDLQNLKTSLEVLTPIGKEFLNVNSISDFISSLWKKDVFQERNVIIMQYLMRSLKRRDLEQMCVKYAIKDKQALCYFEAPLNQEGLKVYLHVVDNIENFTKLEALIQTVACIVNCAPDEIKVIGLRPGNSFVIIITMTANLLIRLQKTNPMNLRKLSQYKVDWIEIEDKIIYIYEGTTTVACSMTVDDRDQEINKLLDALGFEKSVCHIRQNMVAAQELTKNACLDSEFSCIYTGSLAEGFSCNYYSKISRADFDIMFIFNRFPYIVDEDKTQDDAPNNFPLVARVCHDSVRQGFAKLELITVKVPSKLHLAVKFEDRLFLSSLKTLSSLMQINRDEEVLGGVQFERHGPASSVTIESKEVYAKRDLVYGHRCQFWPKCAQNWRTRKRKWPKSADVKNAAELGCHLVPTGFPGSKTEELEWRYSFVKPERNILWLFNDCQRKCFVLLKILNKENLASHFDTVVLKSYHFKTTLLWVLEETDDPDWSNKDLLKHVKMCLVKMMTFIKSRHCPHYFIEHANLFDREIFNEETCGKLSNILDSVLEDPYTALRSCPTFQTLINDVTFIDFDFLHRCHLSFQWFLMCYRQLDELVSIAGGFFWKTTLKHYDTHNKKMAFIVKNRQNLKAKADNPLHELFSRPFVRINHTFLGILKHIEITINKINPNDDEEFEILNLFVDDARKNFETGSKGIDVGSKLRLANFEFMMKEYERVENILQDVVHVFEHNLYGRDEELLTTARDFENIFIQFISNLLKGQSISHEETHAKHKNIIERAYKCGLAQGLFQNQGEHIHPLIDMEKNFLEFLSKKWLLTEVILFPEEIDCVPFPIKLELALLKISSSVENFLFYHPEIFALALRCLVSLSQNNLRTAQIFCDKMSSSLQRIPQKYHVQTLNLIGHLSMRIGNLDDAWRSFSEACRLSGTGESSVWFIALLLLKKFKN